MVQRNREAALKALDKLDNKQNFFLFLRMDLVLDNEVQFAWHYMKIVAYECVCCFFLLPFWPWGGGGRELLCDITLCWQS